MVVFGGWECETEIFTHTVLCVRFGLGAIEAMCCHSDLTIMVVGLKLEYGPSNIDIAIMIFQLYRHYDTYSISICL